MNEQGTQLQQFLEMSTSVSRRCTRPADFRLSGFDEAYLRLGEAFDVEPFTALEEVEILDRLEMVQKTHKRRFNPRVRQCYYNASWYAFWGAFDYADGKATGIIPVDHAWNVYNGKPLDFTWRAESDTAKWSPEKLLQRAIRNLRDRAYWGITVPVPELIRHRRKVGYQLYVDEPPSYPVLKTGVLPWEQTDE